MVFSICQWICELVWGCVCCNEHCSEGIHSILLLFSFSSSTQMDRKHQPSGMLSVAVLYVQCVYVDVHVHENYRSQVDHICRSCGCVHPIRVSFNRTAGIPVVKVLCSPL